MQDVQACSTPVLTVVISTLTTLVIGSMLYYTLKRHDRDHLQELEGLRRIRPKAATRWPVEQFFTRTYPVYRSSLSTVQGV